MNRKHAASAAHSHPRGVYPGGITASLHIAAPPVRRMFPPFFLLGAAMGADAPKGVAGPGGLIPGSARWGMCCANFNKPPGAVSRGSPQFSQKFLRSAGNFRQKRTTPARHWRTGVLTAPARPPPPRWRGRGRSAVPPPAAGGYHCSSSASAASMARSWALCRPPASGGGYHCSSSASAAPMARSWTLRRSPRQRRGGYHCSSSASAAPMARKRGIMPILSGVWTGS